jgi:hypothetical protein
MKLLNALNTTRARLLAGALVVLASSGLAATSTQEAEAQPRTNNNWQNTAAWAQYCQGWPRSGNVSSGVPAAVERSNRDLDNRNADSETLRQALAACRDERLRDRRHNVSAYMCVGRANLIDNMPNRSAQEAYCAYHSAALLARNNNTQRSQAHIGRARALEAIGSPTDVINAYSAAIAADGNAAEARIALARYYTGRREWREARALLIREDSRDRRMTPIVSSAESAAAIIELARASTEPDSADYLALVRVAEAAVAGVPNGNVGVNSALGIAYFESSPDQARTYLWRATEGAVPQSPTEQSLQLDAYYYRSIIEANERNYDQARRHADQAGNTPHAMRQQCLVRLTMGGDAVARLTTVTRNGTEIVTDIDPAAEGLGACSRLGMSREGPLLEGMFWLRYSQYRSQHFNPADRSTETARRHSRLWREAVGRAEQLFSDGKRAVGDNDNSELDWPGSGTVTLRAMYGAGDDLGDYFGSMCEAALNLNDEERLAEQIFIRYKILGSGGQYRCRIQN